MDENYRKSKPGWGQWIIAGALIVVLVIAVLPNFIRARSTTAMNACINNLRQIDAAKQQWSLENNKGNAAIITWDDVRSYFKTKQCSNSYTLGDLNTKPQCKIRPAQDFIN